MEKTINLFEIATRKKLRFPFKGQISVEDLWELSVQNLDTVFKTLNAEVKRANEESLLSTKSTEDEILEVKIAIVKHIVNVKLAEAEKRAKAAANREQRQKLMGLIADKENAELHGKSIAELQAMLAALDE